MREEERISLKLTRTDIIFTAVLAVIVLLLSFFLLGRHGAGYVKITTPYGEYLYPLAKNSDYEFDGLLGKTVIRVYDGSVSFVHSPCPNKTCVSHGAISRAGAFNACLPNGISIEITGQDLKRSDTGEADAVSI